MHKGIGVFAAVLLMFEVAGCGSGVPSHATTAAGKSHCPSGTVSVHENGTRHCLATSASGISSASTSPHEVETAFYQNNFHWPVSTNQAAQKYVATVVRYMNKGGHTIFPNRGPVLFPLRWSASLMNNGGPSGSPIILWQLTMPVSYSRWTAAQWQRAFAILRNQSIYSGLAKPHLGVLANSQGNDIDQAFQLVASNHAAIRLVSGNTVPTNNVGITTPVPTTMLIGQPKGGNSFTTIWSKWLAPVSQYPQLTSQSEANAGALLHDFNSSGQKIWALFHGTSSTQIMPSSQSVPTSSQTSNLVSPSSQSVSPSHLPPLLTVSGKEMSRGIQVQWSSSPQDNLPRCNVSIRSSTSFTPLYSQTVVNGGLLTPSIGTGGLLVVNCGDGIHSTSTFSYHYGVRATGVSGFTDGLASNPEAVIYVQYNRSLGYGQKPNQNMAVYQVTTSTGSTWPVSKAKVMQGYLILTVHLPPNTPTGVPVKIQVNTNQSVATDNAGAPSLTSHVYGSLNTGSWAQSNRNPSGGD